MATYSFDLDPVSVSIDLSVGHIAELKIRDGNRILSPLHRAPWVDDPEADFPPDTLTNVRRLSGDFFCAPFGRNDIEEGPPHGWSANSAWDHIETTRQENRLTAVFRLQRKVMGAIVEKRISLIAGHPFIYQEHSLTGGEGAVSVAHHVMVHMAGGGDLAISPKRLAQTLPEPLETDPARGRSLLAAGTETADLACFPLADGGADLTAYPLGDAHEDFAALVERPGHSLGWSVVSRKLECDRVIVLKRPDTLPLTMLWMSNGGRHYAPWSSRHTGVLGIEDARASPLGHADSCRENSLNQRGIATAFQLEEGMATTVRQIIGACASGKDGDSIRDVTAETDRLILRSQDGRVGTLAYDPAFLSA
ncbi:hypothetical protein OEG86_10120 [Hoeflea alexandrii]|uniref:hypothetical protein n=1 Tax=Hoeflea alexandrii TaxID=288436 RepID=UPI0022700BE6|nr:hypothetical protein [Hoeflea alexandrii]MCY0152529.1 hypothetical protein [Hoeflea alexandrii]